MGTTPIYEWPFPELAGDNNPPADIKALAVAIEASLADLHRAVADVASLPVAGDYPGQRIFVTATGETALWNGAKWTEIWTPFVPNWTNVTLGTTGLVNTGEYIQFGQMVTVKFNLNFGTGGAVTGIATMALPVDASSSEVRDIGVARLFDDNTSTRAHVAIVKATATTVIFDYMNVPSLGAAVGASTNATNPWTFAKDDDFAGTLSYKAAA